jgi:hypothetical protein
MPPQAYSWNCSACALSWVLRATGLEPGSTPDSCLHQIGFPQNCNSNYGLMDGTGKQLRRVLEEHGQPSETEYMSFGDVVDLVQHTTGLMSGGEWYHYVSLRGTQGSNLWIANSAPGYRGVWDVLTPDDFRRLGPMNVTWLV